MNQSTTKHLIVAMYALMLPIIVYNLVQHLVTGAVAFSLARTTAGQEEASAAKADNRSATE